MEKLREKDDDYLGIEVDVCLRQGGVMDVTHDEDTTFGLTVTPYFEYLGRNPEKRMWLDIKNLSAGNQVWFEKSLDSLCLTYNVEPDRLIVESRNWQLLEPFTRKRYVTSCYVDCEESDSLSAFLRRVADSGKVRAISFPSHLYGQIRQKLHRPGIMRFTWANHLTQFWFFFTPLGWRMMRDPQLRVVLIKDKGHYHR
ncbi:MAG: hypothetical protein LUC44_04590 [Prevotellaceae bacterium]|nr:hypothetical protein [Prevotellaceae bacterium]